MNIPKVLNSEEVYKGKIISIRKDTLTRGDRKSFVRETAVSSDAVAVVAMDDQNRILLIHQYRHPMGKPIWEIPAVCHCPGRWEHNGSGRVFCLK